MESVRDPRVSVVQAGWVLRALFLIPYQLHKKKPSTGRPFLRGVAGLSKQRKTENIICSSLSWKSIVVSIPGDTIVQSTELSRPPELRQALTWMRPRSSVHGHTALE